MPTASSFQSTFGGGLFDAYVVKLNSFGSALLYSTFLGGNDLDGGSRIRVHAAGNAYVTGTTHSGNFPTTTGSFQTTFGGGVDDAFVAKLNPTGSALVYSTYLGGAADDIGGVIDVDSSGNAYVTGTFTSYSGFTFPTTAVLTTAS